MLVMRASRARIRSGLMEKTATDQTSKRSLQTKTETIQPPPLAGIYEVPVSGSLFAWEPGKVIRQDYQVLDATTSSMLAGGTPSVGQERNWVNEKTGTKGTVRIRDVKDNCVHFQHFVQPSGAAPNPEIRTRQCKDASGNWILTP